MSPGSSGEREAPPPAVLALLAVAAAQAALVAFLLGGGRPGFVVTPYFPVRGREANWQSFDRLVRERLAREPGDPPADVREDLRRGLEVQGEIYALRNRTHALNVGASRCGAEILAERIRCGAAALPERGAAAARPGEDPLAALEEELRR